MDENKLFEPEPRAGGFFKKQGFYIVLALCLLVVGVAVAVTAFPGNETEPVPSDGQVVQSNQSDDETLTGRKTPTPTMKPLARCAPTSTTTRAPTTADESIDAGTR